MKTVTATILGLALALSALAAEPEVSPDSVLTAIKGQLEQVFQKLDPKPTFEFPNGCAGRSLIVRFKTREYVVHPNIKGHVAETTVKREGPANDGFLLNIYVQRLGEINQTVVPQVWREPYWDTYINVYPVKNTQQQLYFCLSHRGGTDRTLIEKIKKVAKQTGDKAPLSEQEGLPTQPAAGFRLLSDEGKPILTDADIVGYSWPAHTLILKPGVVYKLKTELMGTGRLVLGYPFKVEANGVVCYQGVFTTSFSSASQFCAVINLDPTGKKPDERKDQLSITLGYPTEKFFRGKDPRGDPRIRATLAALGKFTDSDKGSNMTPHGVLAEPPKVEPSTKRFFSTRQGNTIALHPTNATFDVPETMVKWFAEFKNNFHLSRDELAKVENGAGDWDTEYGLICNAALPFARCCAHVGDEGWGKEAVSYADVQVRVYVLGKGLDDFGRDIAEKVAGKVKEITKAPAKIVIDKAALWKRWDFAYDRWYGDYGATAHVDIRAREFVKQTVVFVFMYTNYQAQEVKIRTMLGSFDWNTTQVTQGPTDNTFRLRKPENLTMTLARVADSEKVDGNDYIFVINGVAAYRTLDELKKRIKGLPKGSTLTWAPGCCRIGGEPLLSSKEEMQSFKAFCESCGISFVLVPSG